MMFRRSKMGARPVRLVRRRPQLECLESRYAPTCSVAIPPTAPILRVMCDAADDAITLDHVGTNTLVTVNGMTTTWQDNRFDSILISAGAGDDTVRVLANADPTTVDGVDGQDNVRLGGAAGVQNIRGAVTVLNRDGAIALTVDDAGNSAPRTAMLGPGGVTGLAPVPINWTSAILASLEVRGGSGGNSFTVTNTRASPPNLATTLYTGRGRDTMHLLATARQSRLVVEGELGDDTFHVGSRVSPLDNLQGAQRLVGGSGRNVLFIHDEGADTGETYFIDTSMIDRSGAQPILLDGIQVWTLTLTPFDDTVILLNLVAGVTMSISFGGGNDLFVGPNIPNSWSLSAPGGGTLDGSVTFTSAEYLVGGTADDTFSFQNGGSVNGFLFDTAGTNTLNYTGFTSNVDVNLPLFAATGVSLFVYGFQNVTGGLGDDILVGDDASNVLIGGPGRDLLIAGGWSYLLNPDTLNGGAGEDILIAGWTVHDVVPATLSSVRTTWAMNAPLGERVTSLSALLDPQVTVFSNYAANTLTGGSEDDWFFAKLTAPLDVFTETLSAVELQHRRELF